MTLVLDAGGLVALERGDVAMWERMKVAERSNTPIVTHGGVVAQVWRSGAGRQVRLAMAMSSIDVQPFDAELGRQAGVLLGKAGMRDAIDAAVAILAKTDDMICTSDSGDIEALVKALGRYVDIVTV